MSQPTTLLNGWDSARPELLSPSLQRSATTSAGINNGRSRRCRPRQSVAVGTHDGRVANVVSPTRLTSRQQAHGDALPPSSFTWQARSRAKNGHIRMDGSPIHLRQFPAPMFATEPIQLSQTIGNLALPSNDQLLSIRCPPPWASLLSTRLALPCITQPVFQPPLRALSV